ncbi:MAG: 1-deoxy-D-xylulose-5-phosphate reductoisomerase [Ruminococcaceae bacterium]|nr:1-deoxy-D-xylulose-5-phosphate reductoisomerase [Oscillospiraceae bacterium]
MKTITILGSTGSVGSQTADVAASRKGDVRVLGISFNKNVKLAEEQARRLDVKIAVGADEKAAGELKVKLADTGIKVLYGKGSIEELAAHKVDRVFNSITGCAGLPATLAALNAGNMLALANKESLVSAGSLVMEAAKKSGASILPVDSEHTAIHECLRAGKKSEVKKLILTASGGPFFGKSKEELEKVTPGMALKHPNWSMGSKITIDSATLMNKGFEIVEAAYLYGMNRSKIDVVVHRESIIHSMVEYIDNTVIAQMSLPDMRHSSEYALDYPDRLASVTRALDLTALSGLTFAKPDKEAFPMLELGYDILKYGQGYGAAVNAANETAVWRFIRGEIGFLDIYKTVKSVLDTLGDYLLNVNSLDKIYEIESEAAKIAGK